jgi:hypothetical protein
MQHLLFDKAGRDNTGKILELLKQGIDHYNVSQVVVASTLGDTGLATARLLQRKKFSLVVVTHNAGFKEAGTLEMPAAVRNEIEALGGRVHTGTMPFRSIGAAIREKMGYSQQDLVANVLRMFCQGVKVCVEIVLMASDAGLITPDQVLAIAGTGRGADTLALIKPASSNKVFDLKVMDILAKPLNF